VNIIKIQPKIENVIANNPMIPQNSSITKFFVFFIRIITIGYLNI